MSDSVEALLGGEEDMGEYDLRDEDEDALLEEDDSIHDQSRLDDDILELDSKDDETDFSYSLNDKEESGQRDKFTSERAENIVGKDTIPDTTTQPIRADYRHTNNNFDSNRGRFQRQSPWGGNFRGRGRGYNHRVFHNVQNKHFQQKPRQEGNKCFLNPKFFENVQLQPGAFPKKPPIPIKPWDNQPRQQHPPNLQIEINQPIRRVPPFQNPPFQPFQPPVNQIPVQMKPSVHQRLGFNNQPPFIPPPQPQQQFFEEERFGINSLHNQPPMFQQAPGQNFQLPFNQQMAYSPPTQYNPPPQNNYNNFHPPQPQWQSPPPHQQNWQPPVEHPPPQHHVLYEAPPPQIENNYNMPNQHYHQNMPVQNNYNQFDPVNYNQRQETPMQYQQNIQNHRQDHQSENMMLNNRKFTVNNNFSTNKRRFDRNQVEDGIKRRNFENKNLQEVQTVDTTTPQIKPDVESAPIVETIDPEEDEETRSYRMLVAKQKALRERLIAQKEERRKLAAKKKQAEEELQQVVSPAELIKAAPVPVPVVTKTMPPPINIPLIKKSVPNLNLKVINAQPEAAHIRNAVVNENKVEKEQIKSFLSNRKIFAKDQSLVDTSMVVVSNLAAGTTEVKLRKLCQGVGDIQKFELSPKERQATINFKSVASAHAFYKKYQRFMLDLSMIQVTLKPM